MVGGSAAHGRFCCLRNATVFFRKPEGRFFDPLVMPSGDLIETTVVDLVFREKLLGLEFVNPLAKEFSFKISIFNRLGVAGQMPESSQKFHMPMKRRRAG